MFRNIKSDYNRDENRVISGSYSRLRYPNPNPLLELVPIYERGLFFYSIIHFEQETGNPAGKWRSNTFLANKILYILIYF